MVACANFGRYSHKGLGRSVGRVFIVNDRGFGVVQVHHRVLHIHYATAAVRGLHIETGEILGKPAGRREYERIGFVLLEELLGHGIGQLHPYGLVTQLDQRIGQAQERSVVTLQSDGSALCIVIFGRIDTAVYRRFELFLERIDTQLHGRQRIACKRLGVVAQVKNQRVETIDTYRIESRGRHKLREEIGLQLSVSGYRNAPDQLGYRAPHHTIVGNRLGCYHLLERGIHHDFEIRIDYRRAYHAVFVATGRDADA